MNMTRNICSTLLIILIAISQAGNISAQFIGGDGDGFGATQMTVSSGLMFSGADGDGFTEQSIISIWSSHTKGGDADGFSYLDFFQKYVWSGAIGSGWNISGNWENNAIPGIRNEVVIPAGASHWPGLNAGIFSVGQDPSGNATFGCRSMTIDSGAEMTIRVNCFVENYGSIYVHGLMNVKNQNEGAFTNFNNSLLYIGSMGEVRFEE